VNAGLSADVVSVERLPRERVAGARILAWPGWPHLRRALWYSLLVSALFALVYGGADAISRSHTFRVDLTIAVDSYIPFVPAATIIYSSLYAMFWLVPFVLRTEREVRGLAQVIAREILIAAPFLIALPMPERVMPTDLGHYATAFRLADWINLDHNQFPSLHATFALTVGAVLAHRCRGLARLLIAAWSLAIVAATLLTWQHVIVDAAGALVLTAVALSRSPLMMSRSSNEVRS
jgi:hypothetical protein